MDGSPRVGDHIHVIPGKSLLCVFGDFFGVRVQDVISALDHCNGYVVLQNFRVLVDFWSADVLLVMGGKQAYIFEHVLSHHIAQFGGKLYTRRSTATNNE